MKHASLFFGKIGTSMAFIGIRVLSQAFSLRRNRNDLSCAQVDILKASIEKKVPTYSWVYGLGSRSRWDGVGFPKIS